MLHIELHVRMRFSFLKVHLQEYVLIIAVWPEDNWVTVIVNTCLSLLTEVVARIATGHIDNHL